MVYKGAKYIRYLNIASYLERAGANYQISHGLRSGYAYNADKSLGYSAAMSAKSSSLNRMSAAGVAQTTAALTNQGGGNIGFTYE